MLDMDLVVICFLHRVFLDERAKFVFRSLIILATPRQPVTGAVLILNKSLGSSIQYYVMPVREGLLSVVHNTDWPSLILMMMCVPLISNFLAFVVIDCAFNARDRAFVLFEIIGFGCTKRMI